MAILCVLPWFYGVVSSRKWATIATDKRQDPTIALNGRGLLKTAHWGLVIGGSLIIGSTFVHFVSAARRCNGLTIVSLLVGLTLVVLSVILLFKGD
jgi:hypothetical protein